MTPIPAKVLAVDKQGDQYNVIVRIEAKNYRGSFASLVFGENKPLIGACHDRRLDLIYLQHPGLQAGQEFPLWDDSVACFDRNRDSDLLSANASTPPCRGELAVRTTLRTRSSTLEGIRPPAGAGSFRQTLS